MERLLAKTENRICPECKEVTITFLFERGTMVDYVCSKCNRLIEKTFINKCFKCKFFVKNDIGLLECKFAECNFNVMEDFYVLTSEKQNFLVTGHLWGRE